MRSSHDVVKGSSELRRKELAGRIALLISVVVLGAGVVIYLQSRADNTRTAPTTLPQSAPAPAPALQPSATVTPGGTIAPAARHVAGRFLLTAVAREHLAEAWTLATPVLRTGVTRGQWLRGELPVPPFPVTDLATTGFDVVGTAPNKVILQVLLVPKPGAGFDATRYQMTLIRSGSGAPWRVDYCQPYAPPGVYAPPS